MKYLEYLLTHTYGELPAAVRSEIEEEGYCRRRQLALALAGRTTTAPAPPPSLLSAYYERVGAPIRRRRWLPWALAAGWLLTLLAFALYSVPEPGVRTVRLTAPAPPPDTVFLTRSDTVYRTDRRTVTVRDTVFVSRPAPPPHMVVVHDTVYRSEERPVTGSRPLRREREVLSLLSALPSE